MTSQGKTLVILSPAFSAGENESAMPSQEVLVRHFNKLYPSVEIIIVSFHYPVQDATSYTWHGNKVITIATERKGKWESLLRWRRAWKQLSQLRKRHELIGIFSFFCSECAFIGHYFARRHKLQHQIWVLGQDARKNNPQVKRIRPAAAELVVISDFLQREFERNHGIRPQHIIPIGVDTAMFPPPPAQRDIDLLGAGSLIPLKQYAQFIDVVATVSAGYPALKAVLLGNGPEEAKLKEQIQALNIERFIALPGKQSHVATLAYMQRSWILMHPSAYEGLGMVCLEALYTGAHVISFCKRLDADIPHWHQVKDKEEMAAKALELLQNTNLELSPVLPHSMEDTAIQIMQLFGISRP